MAVSAIDRIEDAVGVGMTPEDLQSTVQRGIEDAVTYIDGEIAPQRERAQRAYRGDLYGNEEEGRSAWVSRDVHDTVQAILPSLMRVFFGSERSVAFASRRADPNAIAHAEQATDYARYIVHQDNDGYEVFRDAFKDALYQKAGVVKWWWDDSRNVKTHHFSGLSEVEVAFVAQEDGVEVMAMEPEPEGTLSLEVKRRLPHGRFRFAAVPPEEFLIDRWARTIDDAQLVAHRRIATVSELVAMGYEQDMVEGYATGAAELFLNTERAVRDAAAWIDYSMMDTPVVLYVEAFVTVDYDGDGIAELRRICTMGDGYEIVNNEPWDHRPFCHFVVDPVPHTFWGNDLHDKLEDLQRVQTDVARLMLDSFALAVHNRTAIVEGQVNVKDVLNPEMGGVVRMRQPGMFQPFNHQFQGQAGLQLKENFERIKESRSGIMKASAGLDAERLQSTTRAAVNATVQGAQQQLELIARNFASGMKRFYRGLLRTVAQNQDRERVVRLRGEYVPIDPRSWDALMDVEVNVVLGAGLIEERISLLREVAQYQAQALKEMGPNNPLCTVGHLSKTLNKLTELGGFKDRFFNELPEDFQVPQPPPKPDPAELLAQAQIAEIQARAQMDYLKLQQQERDSVRDAALKATEMEAKYGTQLTQAILKAEVALRGKSSGGQDE